MKSPWIALACVLGLAPALPSTTAARAPGSAAEACNRLGLDLYAGLRRAPGNLVFSPLSVSAAFALAYAGASGKTREEMADVLLFPTNPAVQDSGFRRMLERFSSSGFVGGPTKLALTGRLWPEAGVPLSPEFLERDSVVYGAPTEALDFRRDPEGSRRTINSRVSEATRGRIPEILGPGSVSTLTRLVLTNALYVEDRWATSFSPGRTRDEPFVRAGGDTVIVPMMRKALKARAARLGHEDAQLLELEYESGDLAMDFLLPDDPDGLPALEARLSTDHVKDWLDRMESHDVDLSLPRFELRPASMDLEAALKSLGLRRAFDPESADFQGMDGRRDLYIDRAVHQAVLHVDEHGIEASAATAATMSLRSVMADVTEHPRLVFHADHPFLFLIRDRRTGAWLFLGRVANPAAR